MLFFLHSIWYWVKVEKVAEYFSAIGTFYGVFWTDKGRCSHLSYKLNFPHRGLREPYIHLTFNRTSRDRIATDKTRTEILKTNVYYVISQNLYVQPPPSPILTPLSWIQPEPPTVPVHPRRRKLQICIYTKLQKQGSHSKPKHSSNVVQNVHFTHCDMLIRQILCI